MTQTPALLIYTIYRLIADEVDAFRLLALRMAMTAKARDGCVFLDVAQDASDPATFRLIEGWRDQAALDAHGASEEFQNVLKDAAALGILGRSIDVYSVAEKRAVDMPS